jgi:hypothetical protein
MIAGTSEPFAIRAGLEVLRHGGNAADAALTTALAQVAATRGRALVTCGFRAPLPEVSFERGSQELAPFFQTVNVIAAIFLAKVCCIKARRHSLWRHTSLRSVPPSQSDFFEADRTGDPLLQSRCSPS